VYDFLNRIHVCGWSAAHVVGRLSLIFSLFVFAPLAQADICIPPNYPGGGYGYCTLVYGGSPVDNGLYYCVVGEQWIRMDYAPNSCTVGEDPPSNCTAQNDVGTLYANFLTVPYEPSTALGNAASMTAITTAYWALPDQLTVCYSGCAHDLIPNASAPGDVYYSGSGPFVLHREYSADRSNVACAGPGTGGTSLQGVVTASAVVSAATSSGTGTGTGSSGSCAPGDTRAGCAALTTPANETLPTTQIDLPGFQAETGIFGGGHCPANVYMTFHGVNKNLRVWDWAQACDTLVTYVKPMVLVLGALAALSIVIGTALPGSRENQA